MAYEHAVVLTGGIATGKSTASALFRLYGFRVIDADSIAHEMLDRYAAEVADRFGFSFLMEDGRVDRKALGRYIFANPKERQALEAILHPPIHEEIKRQSDIQERLEKPYLIDIPLFFESARYPISRTIVVYAPRSIQLERLMKRDALSKEEAIRRIESQIDIEQKRKRAMWVIDNSGDLKHLSKECERIKEEIIKSFK